MRIKEKNQDEKSIGPHRDYNLNKNWWDEIFASLEYNIGNLSIKVQEHDREITCAILSFGPLGTRKGTYVLNFHQDYGKFTQELFSIIDDLKFNRYLNKKEKNDSTNL